MKKIICLLLSLLILISLTGCVVSEISSESTNANLETSSEEITESEISAETSEEDTSTSSKKKASSKKTSSKEKTSSKKQTSLKEKTNSNNSKNISSKKASSKNNSSKKASSKKASSKKASSKKTSSKKTSSKKTSSKNTTSKKISSKITSSKDKSSPLKETTTTSSEPTKPNQIYVNNSNQHLFKKVGSWIAYINSAQGLCLDWTCSSLEFNVNCSGDLALYFQKTGNSEVLYLKIYVDGELIEERTNIKSERVTIATDLESGVHNVKLVRASDIECGSLALIKIFAEGGLELVEDNSATEEKPLYIEAIGDAAFIGWGARLEDDFYKDSKTKEWVAKQQPIARNRENQDGTVAYPYVAAQMLGADAYMVAKQGAGVAATYHKKSGECNPEVGLLPTIYKKVSTSAHYEIDHIPDVFVIDAGAADLDKNLQKSVRDGDKLGIDTVRAVEISVAFLESLKQINPDAKIIWCYGLTKDNTNLEQYITNITTQAGGAEKGIYMLKLPNSARGDYPSAADHQAAAEVLANQIKLITAK